MLPHTRERHQQLSTKGRCQPTQDAYLAMEHPCIGSQPHDQSFTPPCKDIGKGSLCIRKQSLTNLLACTGPIEGLLLGWTRHPSRVSGGDGTLLCTHNLHMPLTFPSPLLGHRRRSYLFVKCSNFAICSTSSDAAGEDLILAQAKPQLAKSTCLHTLSKHQAPPRAPQDRDFAIGGAECENLINQYSTHQTLKITSSGPQGSQSILSARTSRWAAIAIKFNFIKHAPAPGETYAILPY